jgi:hypothetical protein
MTNAATTETPATAEAYYAAAEAGFRATQLVSDDFATVIFAEVRKAPAAETFEGRVLGAVVAACTVYGSAYHPKALTSAVLDSFRSAR